MSGKAADRNEPKLPKPPESWDAAQAKLRAMERHILGDSRPTGEAAFNAAMGDLILSYLDSLPTKDRLEALLALKGPQGFPEDRMLSDADEGGRRGAREELLRAAGELRAEGKLRRVKTPRGTILWIPAGPLISPS